MRIPIVNEQDEIIGHKERSEITSEDIYRVACLLVTDEENRVLLARRGYNKKHHPGKWGPAVAGTVEEGETYESNIIKETEEEIGVSGFTLTPGEKSREATPPWDHFTQEFTLVLPVGFNEFKLEDENVAEVKWFTREELKQKIVENPDEFLSGIKRRYG